MCGCVCVYVTPAACVSSPTGKLFTDNHTHFSMWLWVGKRNPPHLQRCHTSNCTTKTTIYICFPLTPSSSTNICKTYESRNGNQQSHGDDSGCQRGLRPGVAPLTTDGKPTSFSLFFKFFFINCVFELSFGSQCY